MNTNTLNHTDASGSITIFGTGLSAMSLFAAVLTFAPVMTVVM